MEPILRSCAGLDVHKKDIKACIAYGDLDKQPCYRIRTFSTMSSGLRKLKAWLKEHEVTAVVMESTGVYWKPVFNILEGDFDVILANPYHIKNVPGRKTDVKDSQWLAMLLRNGLVPRSFVPPRDIRELRDLTRTRKKFTDNMTAEKNRIQKVLEDANIKLASVVSKIDGVSSMRIIHALLEKDELSKEEIAEMTNGSLRKKVDQLVEALDGRVTEHHRFLLKMHLENIEFLAKQVQKLDEEIQKRMVPFHFEYRMIQTIPGISEVSAATIIAEIGTDMSQFPDEAHLSSWAGVSPGNNESAGVKKSGRTRKGNKFIKTSLTQVAWAASKVKDSAYSAIYSNLAKRRGKKRALVALAHRILIDVYRVMKSGESYCDVGAEAVYQRRGASREKAMIMSLQRAGYIVTKASVAGS